MRSERGGTGVARRDRHYPTMLVSIFAQFVLLGVLHSALSSTDGFVCELWLAPSTMPHAGRGIIAGKDFSSEDTIDSAVSLTVPSNAITEWQLQNYVYASEENGHSMVLWGAAMLFNHHSAAPGVHHFWDVDDGIVAPVSDNTYQPSTTYSPVAHNTTRQLVRGEEIFTSYGDDNWFTDREIALDSLSVGTTVENVAPPALLSEEYLEKFGHCLSNVYVAKSIKALGSYGLFANRAFRKGDLVTVSPVLTLPRDDVERLGTESVLQNYCIATADSTVVLFPIAYSALINHDKQPNLQLEWYPQPNDAPGTLDEKLKVPVDELIKKPFATLDVAYRALSDIEQDTELTISYGPTWVEEWAEFLTYVVEYDSLNDEEKKNMVENGQRPYFRQMIEPPRTMAWPELWRESTSEDPTASEAAECFNGSCKQGIV